MPANPVFAGEPSPQSIVPVRMSFEPGSLASNEAPTVLPVGQATALPPLTTRLRTPGAAFRMLSVVVDETGGLTPSSAVSVTANAPSSVQTTLVASEWVSLRLQAAPGSTAGPALWAQVTLNASPS